MKTKVVLLVSLWALALGAGVPNAMAKSGTVGANARKPEAVSKGAKANARTSKVQPKAAVPSHTLRPGANI
jgi:hypothetical protein